MESECNQKVSYRFTPCKAPGTKCSEYADYDPCGSSDDITDKDLAELLKEEKLKSAELEDKSQSTEKKTTEKKTNENNTNKTGQKDLDGAEEVTPCAKKRRNCRKFIKNPFYTNRLNFSSDLPPPPPEPPPQFFPPVDESSSKDRINCQKRRRKCKKRAEGRDGRRKECETTDGLDEEGQRCQPSEDEEEEKGSGIEDTEDTEDEADTTGGYHEYKDEDDDDDDADAEKKRRRCIRNQAKFPCKKRVSEISISLQPRQIPAAQRDLPTTCPKEKAIMERQMKMGCAVNCNKKKCKKKQSSK